MWKPVLNPLSTHWGSALKDVAGQTSCVLICTSHITHKPDFPRKFVKHKNKAEHAHSLILFDTYSTKTIKFLFHHIMIDSANKISTFQAHLSIKYHQISKYPGARYWTSVASIFRCTSLVSVRRLWVVMKSRKVLYKNQPIYTYLDRTSGKQLHSNQILEEALRQRVEFSMFAVSGW